MTFELQFFTYLIFGKKKECKKLSYMVFLAFFKINFLTKIYYDTLSWFFEKICTPPPSDAAAWVQADTSLLTTAPPLSDEEIIAQVTGEGVTAAVSDDDEEAAEEAAPVLPTARELMDAVNVLNRMSLFCASGDDLRKEISSIESSVAKGKLALKKQAH